jgi:predicted MFS family arabinose efflux permease
MAILIYAGHNVVATCASLVAGRWFDWAGPRVVFATGAAVYVAAYCAFVVGSHSAVAVALAFAAAGAGIGFAEPTESTVVAQLLPDRLRGSGFGVLRAVQSAGDLVATVVAGLLYTLASPAVAFGYAAAWMVAAAIASGALRRPA